MNHKGRYESQPRAKFLSNLRSRNPKLFEFGIIKRHQFDGFRVAQINSLSEPDFGIPQPAKMKEIAGQIIGKTCSAIIELWLKSVFVGASQSGLWAQTTHSSKRDHRCHRTRWLRTRQSPRSQPKGPRLFTGTNAPLTNRPVLPLAHTGHKIIKSDNLVEVIFSRPPPAVVDLLIRIRGLMLRVAKSPTASILSVCDGFPVTVPPRISPAPWTAFTRTPP
jgi:hypothetical protein